VRYHITLESRLGEKPFIVDVEELPSGALDVHVDGRRVAVDVAAIGTQLSVRVEGRMVDLTTEGSLPDLRVVASGQHYSARVESERQRAADATKKGTREKSDKVVVSRMPGRIVKIFVQKGEVVEAGQPLLVMEAMKMENEICARSAGTVAEIHAVEGAAVESNARLVTLV